MNILENLINMIEYAIENCADMNIEMRLLDSDSFITTHFTPQYIELSGDNICIYSGRDAVSINTVLGVYYDEAEKEFTCNDGSVVISVSF